MLTFKSDQKIQEEIEEDKAMPCRVVSSLADESEKVVSHPIPGHLGSMARITVPWPG
jgi:hypothetical protein